jgi:xanthine dehydrogenase small subunit
LIRFLLNDKEIITGQPPGLALLDFIRYHEHLTGTKIGCREGDCGACTILAGALQNEELKYESATSCLMPLGNAYGKHIVTIEGVNFESELNPLQKAMTDEGATQCGFCTPGFVVSLAGFCLSKAEATQQNAVAAVDGNICRCTGYKSIERACAKVADIMKERKNEEPAVFVSKKKILPEYFAGIKSRLKAIQNADGDGKMTVPGTAPRFYFLGGGTDLYVQKHDEMKDASIHFLFDPPELNGIIKEGNQCIIGPSATVSDLLNSPVISRAFPEFKRYAKLVSSTPIRNMATLAGNFVNASPIGDFTIFFLALDAQIELSSGKQKRILPLRKFYKGYKQLDKKPDEMISRIWFELPGKNSLFHFEKVSKRTHLDIASVNTAICLTVINNTIEKAGLSAGGVAPVPLFLEKTSGFLAGKNISVSLIQEAVDMAQAEISPISDARGSKEYKTFLLGQLIKAHFIELFPEMKTEKILF